MEGFKVGQLTKEMVVTRLKALGDPCAAAADVVKKTLTVGLKGASGMTDVSGQLVADVCQGGLTGLLLADQSLAKGAIQILNKVAEVSSELNLDPTETMRHALRGMAEIKKIVKPEDLENMRRQIGLEFMGAGEEFNRLLESGATAAPAKIPPLV